MTFIYEKQYLYDFSYDKNNILFYDFNSTEKAYLHDIIENDYEFAIYVRYFKECSFLFKYI